MREIVELYREADAELRALRRETEAELRALRAENERLLAVVEAAQEFYEWGDALTDTTPMRRLRDALAELEATRSLADPWDAPDEEHPHQGFPDGEESC